MVLSDILLFTPVILGLAGMALKQLPDFVDTITGTEGQSDFERFMVDTRRRGLDYGGAMKELDVRTAFAELRRRASDAVRRDPENWHEALAIEIDRTLMQYPEHEQHLKIMLRGLPYSDIIYPGEARAIDIFNRSHHRHVALSADRRAALCIVG